MNNFDDAIKKKLLEEVDNFNNIAIYNNELNEKSLNRMMLWLNKCDCAFITAFRYKLIDIANPDKLIMVQMIIGLIKKYLLMKKIEKKINY